MCVGGIGEIDGHRDRQWRTSHPGGSACSRAEVRLLFDYALAGKLPLYRCWTRRRQLRRSPARPHLSAATDYLPAHADHGQCH
jgi:hypothetical protein